MGRKAKWLTGNALGFDTETTGLETATARIVTAAAIEVGPSGVVKRDNWLVDPCIPIPPEATKVHGITDEMVVAGLKPLIAIPSIVSRLGVAWRDGLPVIIMNAVYDLSILTEEADRVAQDSFTLGPVLDPMVIDRGMDPYRKDKRNLAALAVHYGVKQEGAHSAEGDALCAARIVWVQAARYDALADFSLEDMQAWQTLKHREWAAGFQRMLRRTKPHTVIDGSWPMKKVA